MNINYHYYTMKTLAVYAGFPEEEAECVAHFSQQVDDYILENRLLLDREPPSFFIKNRLAQPAFPGGWGFLPCPTGINLLRAVSHQNQRYTLTPFHFIPPDTLTELRKRDNFQRTDYRCVEAEKDSQLLINRLLAEFMSKVQNPISPLQLMELGMLLHTYADTYAHCYFSGFHGYENQALLQEASGVCQETSSISELEKITLGELPSIGHGNIGNAPDRCSLAIAYSVKSSENSPLDVAVRRSNMTFFGGCSRNILNILCAVQHKPALKNPAWKLLQQKLSSAQCVKQETEKYLVQSWRTVFPEISYHYNPRRYFDLTLTVETISPSAFQQPEYHLEEKKGLLDIYSREGNQARKSCIISTSQANPYFFDYNRLAYERVKAVTGEYCSPEAIRLLENYCKLAAAFRF